jgi:succinyl-CoA synthetase alpha subunit
MTAPKEKKMGHAGAIVSRGVGTAESKIGSLAEAGVSIARNLDELLAFAA